MNSEKIKQPRDSRGRFMKFYEEPSGRISWSRHHRPSRWSNFKRIVSHNRLDIATYAVWVVDCLAAGFVGGYFGVRIGLG